MSLLLEIPADRLAERSYAAYAVLGNHLGLTFEIRGFDRRDWLLTDQARSACLTLPDSFFAGAGKDWLQPASLPTLPLPQWRVTEDFPEAVTTAPSLPVVAGEAPGGRGWWCREGSFGQLGLDVFGSAFFLLSRYEELALPERDGHGRFPASASLAARGGFLERPLLDEYAEVLWAAIKRLWPRMERVVRQGRLRFTCDVDHPFEGSSRRALLLLRGMAGDLVVRRKPSRIVERIGNAFRARRGDFTRDPNNTFDWLMDACERRGLPATFYFIAGHTGGAIDGCYEIGEPFIGSLLRRIHARGHRIGLHGSYNTFRDGAALARERQALMKAGEAQGLGLSVEGVRQHYLRWDSAVTPGLMQAAGFAYDSTGGFADRAGFRYGTARDFPMWDWGKGRALRLRQRPLVLMETTVIARQYMNLGRSEAAFEAMYELKERCLRMGGDFTLLWHNSDFVTPWDSQALLALLDEGGNSALGPLATSSSSPIKAASP